jgi:hypothetical protein
LGVRGWREVAWQTVEIGFAADLFRLIFLRQRGGVRKIRRKKQA